MSAATSIVVIGQTISHYTILEKLGGGGMGVVYKAEDLKLKRPVALKFLPPDLTRDEEAKARFIHEAQAASALDHPNICNIHEIDETEEGQLFIVMAYYDGETLKKKVARGQLAVEETIDIALQVAQGLAKAHEHGMIHRDIKPANIMVTSDGVVKVVDFGLAKLAGQAQLTKIGSTLGTAAYMSPEQTYGEDVDGRADVWSLGVVLYEMITGLLPFKGEYEQAVIYSILNETPKPIASLHAHVPKELENVIDKCLAKNAAERYQHMAELLADLRSLKLQLESGVTKPLQARLPKRRRTRAYIFSAAAVVLVFALALIAWPRFFQPRPVVIDRKSIAVLPFANLSESKEDEYFSDGITEDVITQLAKIADLKVISRTSVMQYKGVYKNVRSIGRELDVATVLEGSVRRAGTHVRVTAQLIDATDGGDLWAEAYDNEMTEIFAIQSDIAQRIAAALKAKLSSPEKERIEKKPTGSITAYDYYLKGREYYSRHNHQGYEMASGLFVKALELDSAYALAYAGLADACAQRDLLDSALALSRHAIALDPSLPEAHKALGLAYYYKGWMQKSLEASLFAIKLNPNHFPAIVNVGWVLLETDPVEALPWLRKAFLLGPTSASVASAIGTAHMLLVDESNAEKWFKKSLELAPDYLRSYYRLWHLYMQRGDYQAAEAIRQKIPSNAQYYFELLGLSCLIDRKPEQAEQYYEKVISIDAAFQSLELAYVYKETGKASAAQRMFDYFSRRSQMRIEGGNERIWPRYDLARINAVLHKKMASYEWLQKAMEAGWIEYRWGMLDPLLFDLHNEERFKQMMAQVKAKVDQRRKRLEMMQEK